MRQGFLDRRYVVDVMELVQIDVIDLQSLQTGLDAIEDVAAELPALFGPWPSGRRPWLR